jgi:hypothetical protein
VFGLNEPRPSELGGCDAADKPCRFAWSQCGDPQVPEQPVMVRDGSGVWQVDTAGHATEMDYAQGLVPGLTTKLDS